MSRVALLDVNVLLALFNPDHTHHEIAHDWFAEDRKGKWASCALTQNGFIRVLSNVQSGAGEFRPSEAVDLLRRFCSAADHVFWPDAVSLTDSSLFDPLLFRSHRQVSDIYLLGLAKKMGGYLATFDRGIPLGAVTGATPDHIAIISE